MADPDDIRQIMNVIAGYAHAVDDRDAEALAEVFSADAVLHIGRPSFTGRDAIVDAIRTPWASAQPGKHMCGNARILTEGGEIHGEVDFLYFGTDKSLSNAGRYLDEYVHSEGAWRIRSRRITTGLR